VIACHSPQHKTIYARRDQKEEKDKTVVQNSKLVQAGIKELKIEGEIITFDSYLREGIEL